MNIYVEIELDGVITAKNLRIPADMRYKTEVYQYIRNYFIELGYNVGNYLRIC